MRIQIEDKTYLLKDLIGLEDLDTLTEAEKGVYLFLTNWMSVSDTMFFMTSGSTGKQKKIALKKIHLRASAKRTLAYFDIKDGIVLNCLSLHHIGGAMQLIRALEGNLDCILLEPKKNPFENHSIPWDKVSILSLVPYQLNYLVSRYGKELKKIKRILLGGSEVSHELKNSIQTHLLNNCYETYGMTETISHIAIKHLNHCDYFTTLDGVSIQKNNLNQLIVSDSHLSIKNLVTNDVVELISNTTFFWKGRIDNVINSGGKKIHPEEIEHKLSSFIPYPFFVFGIPNEELGNCACILVESKIFIDFIELKTELKKKKILEAYQIPKKIYYTNEFKYTENKKLKRVESIQSIYETKQTENTLE